MHLYKSGDGLRDAGEKILGQYGYGREVYSFVPAWFGAVAYAISFCIILSISLLQLVAYTSIKTNPANIPEVYISLLLYV